MTDIGASFASFVEESGAAEKFCEQKEMETGECMTRVMDTVSVDDGEAPQQPPEPPEEEIPELGGAPEEDGVEEISTIVEDCVGSGPLGFSRPNEHACKRAFEKQQRQIERLEDQLA